MKKKYPTVESIAAISDNTIKPLPMLPIHKCSPMYVVELFNGYISFFIELEEFLRYIYLGISLKYRLHEIHFPAFFQ